MYYTTSCKSMIKLNKNIKTQGGTILELIEIDIKNKKSLAEIFETTNIK